MKEHIYSTDEYEVKIGDPVVDAEVKASSTSVAIPCAAIPDGKYLVSLEVNGTAIAHRDTFSFASGSCTVGDYTLAYSSYAVTVSTTSNNDVVRLVIEPLKVVATDAFKAAVKKVAPEAPNELPAVAAADEGKVLTVNNSGVWGAENEVFYFDVAYNLSDGSYTTQSVNREELVDAINKGKRFAMRYTDGNHLTTIIDVQSFGKSSTEKSANALFIGEATISDDSVTGFTTIYLIASVSPEEDPSVTETAVAALIANHDRFIVTLTPTAPDYSGTMDKTIAEIDAAYKAGQEIWFNFVISGYGYMKAICTQIGDNKQEHAYPIYMASVTDLANNMLIYINVGRTDDGTKQTYETKIYPITPAT